jgi:predicted nucleic acid-binding protein
MIRVFADSFYFFALLNPRDPSHAKAVGLSQTYVGKVVTTGWVSTELADGWAKPAPWRTVFVQMLADLQANPDIRIVPVSDQLLHEGIQLYGQRIDKEWSLTDCISFVIMQREGITEVLTGDHHFEQAGFIALLK